MELSETDRAALQTLEEDLWREETRFDPQRMNEVFAEDFFEFGRSGRYYSRSDTLGFPRVVINCVLPLPDFQARLLAPDVAQVTYNGEVTYDGATYHARRSSIWTRRGEGWVLQFHQGTPIPEGGRKPTRIGILHTSLEKPTEIALRYLVLQQNALQSSLEFSFLPTPAHSVLLQSLESEVPLDRTAIEAMMADFYQNYMDANKKDASVFGLSFKEPDGFVIISRARFEDNYFETGKGKWSIIALGNWDRFMAPPSVVECVLTLLVGLGVLCACKGGNRPRHHHETKGCLFDFTANLKDARFGTLTGFLCPACAEVIRTSHSEQLVKDVRLLLAKGWLGDPEKPSHVASMARKLGYPLFRTGGFSPTWKERIKTALEEEGTKVALEIVSAVVIGALLLWLGLKD